VEPIVVAVLWLDRWWCSRLHKLAQLWREFQQQRLCIARALVHRPSLLLADEPTANLDIDYAQDIVDILRSFHQVGVTVVVSTHDLVSLRAARPRVIALAQGMLASETPP
jgi:ABC-type ATPase involved in cell division